MHVLQNMSMRQLLLVQDESYKQDSGSEEVFMRPHKRAWGLMTMCLALFYMLLQLFWQGGFATFAPTTLIIPLTTLQRFKVPPAL